MVIKEKQRKKDCLNMRLWMLTPSTGLMIPESKISTLSCACNAMKKNCWFTWKTRRKQTIYCRISLAVCCSYCKGFLFSFFSMMLLSLFSFFFFYFYSHFFVRSLFLPPILYRHPYGIYRSIMFSVLTIKKENYFPAFRPCDAAWYKRDSHAREGRISQ